MQLQSQKDIWNGLPSAWFSFIRLFFTACFDKICHMSKLLTRKYQVLKYGKNRRSAFWRNLYEALLHKCRPKAGQNCVFANIANNTFCPQMNREHWGTCTVLIFGFACTFRSLCRRLWRSIHPGGWQWPSIFHKYWQLFWADRSKYPRGKDTLLSCSIHVRIDTH